MKRPLVTVDVVILTPQGIVLIKRRNEPFKGYWALPGGFVEYGEKVEDAAIREAREETGLDVELKGLVGVYSDPSRDPRGHVISIAFLAVPRGGELRPSTDAGEVNVFNRLPNRIAFDHRRIIQDALRTACEKGIKHGLMM
ncbi:MAG: NUDIX hydrolase [Thermoprotei archaeon]|nr:MAG: NUDIX hydrolase [Thermoprotei archaeon]RLF24830.1 MAG: NUDIX hydrolase [Thermoprotei archaeon]